MPESIGMIDVDGHSGFPNLAQMKISAYHKSRGDNVEWWDGFKHYDEEAHKRILALRDMGVTPFGQPYIDFDGGEPTEEQKRLARWCNNKAVFKTVPWEEYGRKCGRGTGTITCLNL